MLFIFVTQLFFFSFDKNSTVDNIMSWFNIQHALKLAWIAQSRYLVRLSELFLMLVVSRY